MKLYASSLILHLFFQVWLPKKDNRRSQCSRGHQEIIAVLFLGESDFFPCRPLRITVASGHCLHLWTEAVPGPLVKHFVNGGQLAIDTYQKDSEGHSRWTYGAWRFVYFYHTLFLPIIDGAAVLIRYFLHIHFAYLEWRNGFFSKVIINLILF